MKSGYRIFAGAEKFELKPLPVYSDIVCDFLDELSRELRNENHISEYPNIKAFSFWCRKGNIQKLKSEFMRGRICQGRGIVFHIAPSNVPVNFAFSFVFGLLSGNANIVRVPSKENKEVEIICEVIQKLWKKETYSILAKQNLILSYDKNNVFTQKISEICDIRIIWGGDDTICQIRKFPLKPKALELVFADRYSFGVLQIESLAQCNDNEMKILAKRFYNDTYGMDQNACSTPHLLFFKAGKDFDKNRRRKYIEKFWDAVYEVAAQEYSLENIKVSDKYMDLCKLAIEQENCKWGVKKENLLYVMELQKLPENITRLRGRYGLFFQYEICELEEITPFIQQKIQSMLYFGVDRTELERFVELGHMSGIDRIVPFGNALDIGVFWDGYDIVTQLSRVIEIV